MPAKSRRPPLLFFMITGYFGLPGCGKSTVLAKLAQGYIRSGYRVFCLDSAPVDGCHLISFDDLGRYDMSCSVILLDEVSLFADNRDYKRFSDVVKQFMILHRHYHCDIVWFTQQFDGVDRKIRELTTCLYYVRSRGMFSYAVRINRFIFVDKEKKQIQVGYKLPGIISYIFGWLNHCIRFCFRPRYYRYFDSYEAPELPKKDFQIYRNQGS